MDNTPPRDRRYYDPDEEIRKAMERGDFDHLAGKGKPLQLRRNPHLSPEEEIAYHLLQEAGFLPDWVEERRDIQAAVAQARHVLEVAWTVRLERLQRAQSLPKAKAAVERERIARSWERTEQQFCEAVVNLNRRIRDYNLKAPALSVHLLSLRVDEELQRLKMAHPEPEPTAERPDETQAEAASLSDGMRQIVTTRERMPRTPAWDTAWKRTLWRFARRLRSLRRKA